MSSRTRQPHHAVQFYRDDTHLFESVTAFLGQGFLLGQPAMVVTTPDHAAGILALLQQQLIDVERAQSRGYLIVLDALSVIESVFDGEVPNPAKLQATMGPLFASMMQHRARRARVRAFGEMSSLLMKQGRYEAALRLESLGNDGTTDDVITLCGFELQQFHNEAQRFEQVCGLHSHVMMPVPGEGNDFLRVHHAD